MKFTKELMEKIKTAGSAEELLKLAKAEGVELTAEDAEKAFARLHKSGELADEELDNVSGGGCGNGDASADGVVERREDLVYLYDVGDQVEVFNGIGTVRGIIKERFPKTGFEFYEPHYSVEVEGEALWWDVAQRGIQVP